MLSSPAFPHTINRDILSSDDFERYLRHEELSVAHNLEIEAHELLLCSRSKWEEDPRPQGVIILFWVQDMTNEPDSNSPVGKKIAPRTSKPTLHHFLDGMCTPVEFEVRVILAGQIMLAKNSN